MTATQTSKFIVSSSVLLKALKAIGFANSPNTSVPIVENVRMRLNGPRLHLDTTDLNLSGSIFIPIEGADDQATVCVPYKRLVALLSALAEQPVTITATDSSVQLLTDNGKYTLAGQLAADWPKEPTFSGVELGLHLTPLISAIAQVLPFVGPDYLKPAMTGVSLTLTADQLTVVATSGKVLARRVVALTADDWQDGQLPEREISCIVSARQAKAITSLKAAEWGTLEINHAHLRLRTDNLTITGRLIDERYPDVNGAIGRNPMRMDIGRSDLLHTLSRLGQVVNQQTKMIRLSLNRNNLTLSAEDTDLSNDGSEKLLCDYDGMDTEVGLHLDQLRECIESFDAKMIQLDLQAPNRPVHVRPSDLSSDDPNLSLMMPLQL